MRERTPSLRYDVNERPPFLLALGLGVQSALFVVGGTVFLPILMEQLGLIDSGEAAYLISASMLIGGITTAITVTRVGYIGSGYMLFMGTSGAFFAATMDAVELAGIGFVAALAMIAAPTEWAVAWLFRFLRNIFTAPVGGAVVMCVAVTIVPLTIDAWQGTGTPKEGSIEYLAIGGIAVLVTVAMIAVAPPRLRLWAPVAGIAIGSLAALAMGEWHFDNTNVASIVGFPISEWQAPTFPNSAEAWAILGAFIIATLSGTIETVGDTIAVQKVSLRDFRRIDYESIRGSLNADGVGNVLAGVLGSTPNTTYSSPIGMIPVIGVASRIVGLFGAGSLVVMAFFPILTAFILDLPGSAIGGVTFVTMIILFVTGMRIVIEDGISGRSALIVGLAFWGGFAAERDLFFPGLMPEWADPVLGNAISTGSVIAVTLSAIFTLMPRKRFTWRAAAFADRLPDVLAFVNSSAREMKLGPVAANRLEVCTEEVFLHLVDAPSEADPNSRRLRIEIMPSEDEVTVTITDRSEARDVDAPVVPSELLEAQPEELRDLGLQVLSHLAAHVSHTTISGWHYVEFSIERGPEYSEPSEQAEAAVGD